MMQSDRPLQLRLQPSPSAQLATHSDPPPQVQSLPVHAQLPSQAKTAVASPPSASKISGAGGAASRMVVVTGKLASNTVVAASINMLVVSEVVVAPASSAELVGPPLSMATCVEPPSINVALVSLVAPASELIVGSLVGSGSDVGSGVLVGSDVGSLDSVFPPDASFMPASTAASGDVLEPESSPQAARTKGMQTKNTPR
jgi:hypothetical protein